VEDRTDVFKLLIAFLHRLHPFEKLDKIMLTTFRTHMLFNEICNPLLNLINLENFK
jgi:hypothetical protein